MQEIIIIILSTKTIIIVSTKPKFESFIYCVYKINRTLI